MAAPGLGRTTIFLNFTGRSRFSRTGGGLPEAIGWGPLHQISGTGWNPS